MEKQPLVVFVDGQLTPVDFYETEYPLKQTQALLLTADELSAWVEQARLAVGGGKLPALDTYLTWLAMIDNLIEDLWLAVEEEEDEQLIACCLSADDPLIELIDLALDLVPEQEDIQEQIRGKAVGATLACLLDFWIKQVKIRPQRLYAVAIGDGEVFSIIERQDALSRIHF